MKNIIRYDFYGSEWGVEWDVSPAGDWVRWEDVRHLVQQQCQQQQCQHVWKDVYKMSGTLQACSLCGKRRDDAGEACPQSV